MTDRFLTTDQVRALLRAECEKAGGQSPWARANKISQSFVNQVINGVRPPSWKIADRLGLVELPHAWKKKT